MENEVRQAVDCREGNRLSAAHIHSSLPSMMPSCGAWLLCTRLNYQRYQWSLGALPLW